MKRYFRYIFLTLILGIMAMSCVEEMDVPQPKPGNDAVTLVPRVKSFSNQYVTKSDYSADETKITKLAVLVFDSNTEPKLVHIEEASGENITSLRLNKSLLNKCDVTKATIVMIANVDLANVKNSGETSIKDAYADTDTTLELDDLNDYSFHFTEGQTVVTSLGDGFNGFPMIGISGPLDLSSSVDHSTGLPVHLHILYAKVNFSISVAPGTENQNYTGVTPSFTLSGYSVHNVSKRTPYTQPTGATVSTDYAYTGEDEEDKRVGIAGGTTALNGDAVSFTFYVAESRYAHNSTLQGVYPDDSWLTTTHYDDLKQQYKPKIANLETGTPSAGLATYVTVSGTYKDYRGTNWTVDYKVYLGKDNSQNFEVDRNSEYTNYLTIKGIRNNDSYDDNTQSVWVDHRVNVSTGDIAGNVTITRETLIDSHFEVRPLRVNWPEGAYDGVRVYLPTNSDGNLVDWIGIERFTGENCKESTTYCYKNIGGINQSIGKRKYFTTTLISELQTMEGEFGVNTDKDTGRKYIYLLNGECAWIYFDEYTSTSEDRTASIELEFYTASGPQTPEVYNITQRKLQSLGGYTIESYEEYLHSYDSADKYNLSTSPVDYTQQGLIWDDNMNYSSEVIVVVTEAALLTAGDNRYDYFHESDQPQGDTYYSYINRTTRIPTGAGLGTNAIGAGTGLDFTNRASAKALTKVMDMGTVPESAYQYCLSKNKFTVDEEGSVSMTINWYLPDVYEIQKVLNASDGNSYDFKSDALYWSSQPSFTTSLGALNEDSANARAVGKSAGIQDESRSTKHRIRCFYTTPGVSLSTDDMENRIPDGVGGNYSFYMKSYKDGNPSYFHSYMLENAYHETDDSKTLYENKDYPYPTVANPGTFTILTNAIDNSNTPVVGFAVNPIDEELWGAYTGYIQNGYVPDQKTFYSALTSFPGLSQYEVVYDDISNKGGGRQLSTLKQEVKIENNISQSKLINSTLPGKSLATLDHLTGGNMLNISFSGAYNTNAPFYEYVAYDPGSQRTTTTRYWQVPTYSESSYLPKAATTTKPFNGTGSAEQDRNWNWSSLSYTYTEAQAQTLAEDNAKTAALNNAIANAQNEYQDRTCTPVAGTSTITITGGSWNRARSKYTANASGSVTIECKADPGSPVTYYKDASGGGWVEQEPQIEYLNEIETDKLVMYCGNSFTISVSDAKDEKGNYIYYGKYKITKVKVFYSGNNYIGEYNSFLGFGGDNVYARFVDDNINLNDYKLLNVPILGSTEKLQLPGMDYSEDGESGWHQWSGQACDSITLTLCDYNVNYNASTINYSYLYDKSPIKQDKSIVIERIEVKCTPISTE